MIVWTDWPLWLVLAWANMFKGCPSRNWSHHPGKRIQRSRRWWGEFG